LKVEKKNLDTRRVRKSLGRSADVIVRWLLGARRAAFARCERCAAWTAVTYDPHPVHGRGLWRRCLACGAARLLLCQMRGSRQIFEPPMSYLESEAMEAAAEARQAERWIASEQEAAREAAQA
jgi:hypothetical protein